MPLNTVFLFNLFFGCRLWLAICLSSWNPHARLARRCLLLFDLSSVFVLLILSHTRSIVSIRLMDTFSDFHTCVFRRWLWWTSACTRTRISQCRGSVLRSPTAKHCFCLKRHCFALYLWLLGQIPFSWGLASSWGHEQNGNRLEQHPHTSDPCWGYWHIRSPGWPAAGRIKQCLHWCTQWGGFWPTEVYPTVYSLTIKVPL